MNRLIDADELKLELKWLEIDTPVYHDVVSTIDEMPTVEVVAKSETTTEVVRCKDCRHYLYLFDECGLIGTRLHFYETNNVWTGDCFCSWGERREDEKTD